MFEDKLAETCEHANAIKAIMKELKGQEKRVLNISICDDDLPKILISSGKIVGLGPYQVEEPCECFKRYRIVSNMNSCEIIQYADNEPAPSGNGTSSEENIT